MSQLNMPDLKPLVFITACLLVFPAGPATAAETSGHEEAGIVLDEQLTLPALLGRTLEHHPQAGVIRAGQDTAAAEEAFGDRWFPDAAELSGFHLSDSTLDDTGFYENEASLNFPLWLPGEKKAQVALGEASAANQSSRERAFRWRVSGLLRQQSWRLARARRHWELALEQEQRLQEVYEQVALFTEVGDTSRSDLLSTMQELATWKSETIELEAEYQDAAREFAALTGSHSMPSDLTETLTGRQDIGNDHPAMQQALDQLAKSSAAAEVVSQGNTARPSVNIFWRDFRGERNTPDVNALGLGFSMPLGKSPSRRPEIAQANEELAMAEARLLQTRRELDLQLHEARHLLHTTEQQLALSEQMMEAARERHRLDELAFDLGEISVRQWLRRLSETKEIQQSHELLLLQQGAAVAAYNQAAGESL